MGSLVCEKCGMSLRKRSRKGSTARVYEQMFKNIRKRSKTYTKRSKTITKQHRNVQKLIQNIQKYSKILEEFSLLFVVRKKVWMKIAQINTRDYSTRGQVVFFLDCQAGGGRICNGFCGGLLQEQKEEKWR